MGFRIVVVVSLLLLSLAAQARDWSGDNNDGYRQDQRWNDQRNDQRWDRGNGHSNGSRDNSTNGSRDNGDVTENQKRACEPEVFRLCSWYIPNRDAITSCLHKNISKLNADCRAVMEGRLR